MVGGAQARVLVPTLQQMCIGLIAKNIGELEDADALGEHLGGVHLDRIAAIVSKNRALTGETVKLFLHVSRRELKLFDCTSAFALAPGRFAEHGQSWRRPPTPASPTWRPTSSASCSTSAGASMTTMWPCCSGA